MLSYAAIEDFGLDNGLLGSLCSLPASLTRLHHCGLASFAFIVVALSSWRDHLGCILI